VRLSVNAVGEVKGVRATIHALSAAAPKS
jgi:hypothetical protein